ncbi:MAG: PspC domain-containing protein [Patescibacteria group bacterium]
MKNMRKLKRIPDRGILGGVCAGLAYYLGIPVWVVRVVWAVVILWLGFGILLYPIFWIFMPKESAPEDFNERTG